MKKAGLLFAIFLATQLYAQNRISEIQGCWGLVSPKNSPGPEFIAESYKGITHLVISPELESRALGQYNKDNNEFEYWIGFIPSWDGKRLTGNPIDSNGTNNKQKVSVPLTFNSKKNTITIHIKNPEYGNVKFIYRKMECDDRM